MTPGTKVIDLRTGEAFIYCGPQAKGTAWVKNARGLRRMGLMYLRPATGDGETAEDLG